MKCSRKPFLLLLIALANASAAGGANLDLPLEQRATVRTEIDRGFQAARDCSAMDVGPVRQCLTTVNESNVQRRTATDAFLAGFYFSAWLKAAILADNYDSASNVSYEALTLAEDYMRKSEAQRTKLGLSFDEVCAAAYVMCDNVRLDWTRWLLRIGGKP